MRLLALAARNAREILRDKLTLFFGVLFPVAILALMALIGRSVPADIFPIGTLAPGIAVFGLSFLSLFGGLLMSKDRSAAFMARLEASPLTPADLIGGYLLPLIPMGMAQSLICLLAATALGLPLGWGIPLAAMALTPMALFYAALGLALGCVLNDKQIGGVCGALVTNLSAWFTGVWFDPGLVGGGFEAAAEVLPFLHGARCAGAALTGEYSAMLPHLGIVCAWGAGMCLAAVAVMQGRKASA